MLKPFSCKILTNDAFHRAHTILQTLLIVALQTLAFESLMNVSKMLKNLFAIQYFQLVKAKGFLTYAKLLLLSLHFTPKKPQLLGSGL